MINKTSNLCFFTQKGHPIYPAGTAGFSSRRNGGLYRATGKHWLIRRTGSGDEPLCQRRVWQVQSLVTIPHFPRMLPSVGFPAPLLLGICFGQRDVRRHDMCRNLKCDGMIAHALLTLTFYPDRRRASPKLLLPFHLDPKRIHVVQTRV